MAKYPLRRVDTSRGAPMGRFCDPITTSIRKARVHRVKMSSCGAYDEGGAYWGVGTPLYRAVWEHESGFICERFVRANSREEAILEFGLEPEQLLIK